MPKDHLAHLLLVHQVPAPLATYRLHLHQWSVPQLPLHRSLTRILRLVRRLRSQRRLLLLYLMDNGSLYLCLSMFELLGVL